jgi:hypothetical protein
VKILPLIVVTPDQLEITGARDLSERIIQGLASPEIVDLIGIGSSIPGVIAAVNLSKNIANVNIQSLTLDYIPITVYGKQEAIFFEISRDPETVSPLVQEFERQGEPDKTTFTVVVFRADRISAVTNQILYKLSKYARIKVIASGFAITTAVRAILQVITSGISREPISLNAITIESISRKDIPEKKVPAIQIYLEKGHATVYPPRHAEVLTQITQR